MRNQNLRLFAALLLYVILCSCNQQQKSKTAESEKIEKGESTTKKVTLENYVLAETDWNFLEQMKTTPINQWLHKPPVTMENQTIIRSNADVVYSLAAVDVSEGATFSIPERQNGAMQLMQLIDENHYTRAVIFAGESITLTPKDLSTGNYIYILARTRISDDLEETKTAQASMVIDAKSAKPYTAKGFNDEEVTTLRNKLIKEVTSGEFSIDASKGFGKDETEVDTGNYLHCAAMGWGGLPPRYAQYTAMILGQGSDDANQTLTFPKPDLDYDKGGFFSITTYNSESWIDQENFYISMDRMRDNGDGTVTVDFNSDTPYSVTVSKGWNATLRQYLPKDWKKTVQSTNDFMTIPIERK
ncbi:DUF1254 domain-containing protein [Reichenbachiella sp.]|uniref:DUF1254 domain-containing protein n=1 Tax=Reichenbachiella sp. TaxID=2184521 RepID=UPI003B5D049A